MSKLISKVYSANNFEVAVSYTWDASKNCTVIKQFAILHCGLDVTSKVNKKRLSRIIADLKLALANNSGIVKRECGAKVAA